MNRTHRVVGAALLLVLCQAAWAKLDVPLLVAERDGEHRTTQPATSGVPLPAGAFTAKDIAKLRLVGLDGKEIPCQFTPTVLWPNDRSVRWVLLDFQVPAGAYTCKPVFLRDDGPAQPIDKPIVVTEESGRILVTTGPLRFAVKKSSFNLIDEAWLDDTGGGQFDDAHRVVAPGRGGGPWLWNNGASQAAFRSYAALNDVDCQVTVEEAGPMRVAIKAVGRHLAHKPTSAPEDRLLDFVVRIHAYRGQSYLKVHYVAECRQGTSIGQCSPVDKWNLVVPATLGKPEELTYRFGTEGTNVEGTFGRQDRAWLLCESPDRYELGGAAYHHSTTGVLEGRAMATEPHRLGFVDLSGKDFGVMIGVRWFWENNPKGLIVGADGSVQAALWPSLGRKTPISTGFVNERRANFFPGMSKTHELVLYFHGATKLGRLNEVYAMLRRPLFAMAEPSWYCEKTRGLGKMPSSDPTLYAADKRWIVTNYDHFFEQNRRALLECRKFSYGIDAFGMFNFGDTVNHVEDGRRDKVGDRPDRTDVHWDNNYYRFPHCYIAQFARTGNLDMLELAEQASTHLQDVDILCWSPNAGFAGAPRYSAGLDHIRMNGSGDGVYQSDTYNHYKNQSLFERYWLLGDRRALDMGVISADYARGRKTAGLSQSRSIGHAIIGLLTAYETTLDPSYLAAAERIIENTRSFRKSGSGAWQDGIALEGHQMWYELTGDRRAIETVLGGVDAALAKRDLAGSLLQSVGFAYGQTGDEKYLTALVKGFNNNVRGRRTTSIDFGNSFHSTGLALWYLTEKLPKKEDVPVLKWNP